MFGLLFIYLFIYLSLWQANKICVNFRFSQ